MRFLEQFLERSTPRAVRKRSIKRAPHRNSER